MARLTINAHYDGTQILLDQPVELPVGGRLLVTVLDQSDDERDYHTLALAALAAAYGTSEPEYSEDDLRP